MGPAAAKPDRIGQSYRSWDGGGQFDVIVVGSGMGALTAAALLAKRGHRKVLVLERHYVVGGYTHVFRRPGYEWDVGLHYVGQLHQAGSELGRLLADITDGQLAWAPLPDVYDRILIGGESFDFVAGQDQFRAALVKSFPTESHAIDQYLHQVLSCASRSRLYFAQKALPGPLALLAGRLLRAPFLRQARVTTTHMLSEITGNRMLAGVLAAQWGDYGLPPERSSFGIHAIIANHYLEGAAYPIGGASQMAATIVPTIERAGGQVLINAQVTRIVVENGRAVGVEMEDGRVLRAKTIISGVGFANTFARLLPAEMAAQHGMSEKLPALEPSLAHVNLYVGLRHTDQELGFTGTNLWLHPTADHNRNLATYLADPASPLPYVYVSFPSAKDPTFAERFPGRSTLQLIAPARYDWFSAWQDKPWKRRGEDYDALKQTFTDRLLAALHEHVPSVRGRIDHAELSTPLSTQHFAGYAQGEPYGLAHTPARFEQRYLRPRTPIRGLYLTGQDIAVCGIAGALVSGVLTASALLRRNLFK